MGLSKSQVRALLPEWWNDDAAATPAGAWEFVLLLARMLSIDAKELAAGVVTPTGAVSRIAYKHGRAKDSAKILASSLIASSIAGAILASSHRQLTHFDRNPRDMREHILSSQTFVDFEGVLGFCWDNGIPVIPLRKLPVGLHKMDGAVLRVGTRPVIVISRRNDSRSWLSFILAHELGHFCRGHLQTDAAIVDIALQAHTTYQAESEDDRQEREADEFALELLGGPDCDRTVEKWSPQASGVELAAAARDEAGRLRSAPGHLVLRHAFRTKRWKEAQNALRFLDEDFDAHGVLSEFLAKSTDLDTLADDLKDLVMRVTGLAPSIAPNGAAGHSTRPRRAKRSDR